VLAAGAPLGQGRAVVILLHGRGAAAENILTLAPEFDRPALAYLAPSAANNTWYPFPFISEIEKNEPYLSSALHVIESMVADIERAGTDRSRIVLAGFSQGACLASEFMVRHPGQWGGLLAFSGGLIGPPGQTWDETGSFEGTPMFLGCSDVDAHIPKTRVEESAAVFVRMGADVLMRLYPGMGHLVSPDEIEEAQTLLDRF
jgi:predicted esterase